jgi:CIC family chloride channel protein
MIKLGLAWLHDTYNRLLEAQQVRLSTSFEGLPLLAFLGLICGIVSGGVIILFRIFMDQSSQLFLPGGGVDNFEQLDGTTRFWLCVAGGLVIGLLLQRLKSKSRSLGVVHVLERLEYHQGHLPLKNAIIQFIMASIALLSGHSVGREGPSVHLGATAGSLLGRSLRVPNNGVRILVGCGVAAAISAAFNTPLAGVIFAMEVVIMDYTVMGFTPVILAAVSATSLTRMVFGDATVFALPELQLESIQDLPMVAMLGAFIGCVSAAFIQLTLFTTNFLLRWPIWIRTTLAGLITGTIAMALPQIMGTGYDTVNHLLLAQIGLLGVFLLMAAKLIATSAAIGFGIPAGIIGPTVFIGAAAGALIGFVAQAISPELQGPSYYAMLGMAAMMAATLQAPLAALIFLLELTAQQSVILPGMAAVIIASMMTRVVFNKTSIYQHLLLARGLDYRNSPMSKELRRIGVASVMEKNIRRHSRLLDASQAAALLEGEPRWILLVDEDDQRKTSLLPATDLARHLNDLQKQKIDLSTVVLDLMTIPAKRLETRGIAIIATLQEAHERMQTEECDVLFITGAHGATKQRIYGVITREHIDRSYQF